MDWSRELSVVCLHGECVIGLLKHKYAVLQGVLPSELVAEKDEQYAGVDEH